MGNTVQHGAGGNCKFLDMRLLPRGSEFNSCGCNFFFNSKDPITLLYWCETQFCSASLSAYIDFSDSAPVKINSNEADSQWLWLICMPCFWVSIELLIFYLFASPSFIIPKSDPMVLLQWVNDYRELNSNVVIDSHPLPQVDDILADCSKGKIWAMIDMTDSFFQTKVHLVTIFRRTREKYTIDFSSIQRGVIVL